MLLGSNRPCITLKSGISGLPAKPIVGTPDRVTCVTARRHAHHHFHIASSVASEVSVSFVQFKLRGLDFYPGGTCSRWSCQPSLDAHLSSHIGATFASTRQRSSTACSLKWSSFCCLERSEVQLGCWIWCRTISGASLEPGTGLLSFYTFSALSGMGGRHEVSGSEAKRGVAAIRYGCDSSRATKASICNLPTGAVLRKVQWSAPVCYNSPNLNKDNLGRHERRHLP